MLPAGGGRQSIRGRHGGYRTQYAAKIKHPGAQKDRMGAVEHNMAGFWHNQKQVSLLNY
jgi:hypothetical protein